MFEKPRRPFQKPPLLFCMKMFSPVNENTFFNQFLAPHNDDGRAQSPATLSGRPIQLLVNINI